MGIFGTCLVPPQYLGSRGLGDTIRDFRDEPSYHDLILDFWDFTPKPTGAHVWLYGCAWPLGYYGVPQWYH